MIAELGRRGDDVLEYWWLFGLAAAGLLAAVGCLLVRARRPRGLPDGLAVRYTRHARERMGQRGVGADQIMSVLTAPQRHTRDAVENSVRLERDFRGRTLKVWVAEPWPATREIVVKSTAWQYLATVRVPQGQAGRLIGRGGSTIQNIRTTTGATIHLDKGVARISAGEPVAVEAARRRVIEAIGG